MSFNKKQLGEDSKFAKKVINKPQPIIPVSKCGGMVKKSGKK